MASPASQAHAAHCRTHRPRHLPLLSTLALVLGAALIHPPAAAFTQSGLGTAFGNGVPMGHEWVTRLSALEVLGGDPIMPPDPNDPRRRWTQGLAKNTSLNGASAEVARIKAMAYADQRYQSTYKVVYDAIVGERWVDMGGFNVANSKMGAFDCWDAVAQEATEIQYDHFMRQYNDNGGDGGVNAASQSQQRFVKYFVAAAMSPPGQMLVWDGGGYSSLTQVDRNYFLLGRAAHMFQDSFSSEHTVRIASDNLTRVRQVKSYLCAPGSEQHNHSISDVLNFISGDVIWNPGTNLESGWGSYKPSNMKVNGLVATEASKDLWAAFIRVMAVARGPQREAAAQREAKQLVVNWLSFDNNEMRTWYDPPGRRDATYVLAAGQTGPGKSVSECMKKLGYASGTQQEAVNKFIATQRMCLFNVAPVNGYADLFDTSLHMPFNWQWTSGSWQTPPANWQIPQRPADTGRQVHIRHSNGNFLGAPDGIGADQWVWVRPNMKALDLVMVGEPSDHVYRVASDPNLFLSYRQSSGAVKLYASPNQANYKLVSAPNNSFGIYNLYWNDYMWLSGESPYITGSGDPNNANAQWRLEDVR